MLITTIIKSITTILTIIPILNLFLTTMKVKGRGSSWVGLKPITSQGEGGGRVVSGINNCICSNCVSNNCISWRLVLMFDQEYEQCIKLYSLDFLDSVCYWAFLQQH